MVVDPGRPQPLLGARPDAGQQPHVERREERRLLPGRTTVSPPGLRRSEATLATTLQVATPSEHVRELAPRTAACTASASFARAEEVRRDLAEVEVALVDPGLLDRRDDLADGLPDRREYWR